MTLNRKPGVEFGVSVSPIGSVTIAGLTFTSSSFYNEGTLTLINSTISDNANSGYLYSLYGGGIDNAGTLTLINSTVSGNRTDGSGGGIYNGPLGKLTLISSTVWGNLAEAGGGISNDGGTFTLLNSTISDNMSQGAGGGILNASPGAQMKMIFCTIYRNTSNEDGGGIWNGAHNSASQLMIENSLVAGNKSPAGPDILGPLTSQGHNLIQNTQDTKIDSNQAHGTDLLQVASSALGIDPLLRNNNGPTQTHALFPGSVAIDRIPLSDCRIQGISTDQRGVRRPQGVACDIGAYELLK